MGTGSGGSRPDIGVLKRCCDDTVGRTWRSIAKVLPSDFPVSPIAVHPNDPDTVYVMPHEGMTRAHLSGRLRALRSGQREWGQQLVEIGSRPRASEEGELSPSKRDAMDTDEVKSPAYYFGTTTGQLWIGRDGGENWTRLFDSLPPIHCVKVAVV